MWIKSPTDLARRPKTFRLSRNLKINIPTAVGHITCFWLYCCDHIADDGVVIATDEAIAQGSQWDGDPNVFMEAMRECGFMDNCNLLIDWAEVRPYPPRTPMRKAWDVIRSSRAPEVFRRDGHACKNCGSNQNLTVDHIKPISKGGDNKMENLQTLCGSCNSSKKDKWEDDPCPPG